MTAASPGRLQKAPADVTGHFVLAWVLYSTSRLQEAEESAREAVMSDSSAAAARLLLAQIHLRENKFSAVVDDLNADLALGSVGPSNDRVQAVRAEALRALGKNDAPSESSVVNR